MQSLLHDQYSAESLGTVSVVTYFDKYLSQTTNNPFKIEFSSALSLSILGAKFKIYMHWIEHFGSSTLQM